MSANLGDSGQKYQRGNHPNSIANLRPHPPWEPGVCQNPGGVRKGTVFISERMKFLQSLSPEEFEAYQPQTVADEIAQTRVKAARSSKMQGLAEAKEVLDRTEGKAPQKVEVSNVSDDERRRIAIQTTMANLGLATEQEAIDWLASDPQTAMIVGNVG